MEYSRVQAFYEEFPFPHHVDDEAVRSTMALGEALAAWWRKTTGWAAPKTWVDLGCGTGEILCGVAASFPLTRVIGIDFSRPSLEYATALAEQKGFRNVELRHGDFTRLGQVLGPIKADAVSAMGSMHHAGSPRDAFRNTLEILAPECGIYFLGLYSAINRGPLYRIRDTLFTLHPEPSDHAGRLQSFRDLFLYSSDDPDLVFMANRFGGPDKIPAQWIMDTFVHPVDNAYDVPDVLQWIEGRHLKLIGWLGVENVEARVRAARIASQFFSQDRSTQLELLDRLDPQRFKTFVLAPSGLAVAGPESAGTT